MVTIPSLPSKVLLLLYPANFVTGVDVLSAICYTQFGKWFVDFGSFLWMFYQQQPQNITALEKMYNAKISILQCALSRFSQNKPALSTGI